MSAKEKEKREEIVKGMKKGDGKKFEKRYPGRGKEVMYATATKRALKEEYKEILYSLLEANREPEISKPLPVQAPPSMVGMPPSAEAQRSAGLTPLAGNVRVGGDYIDNADRIHHHSKMLKLSMEEPKDHQQIERHTEALKRLGVDVDALVKTF